MVHLCMGHENPPEPAIPTSGVEGVNVVMILGEEGETGVLLHEAAEHEKSTVANETNTRQMTAPLRGQDLLRRRRAGVVVVGFLEKKVAMRLRGGSAAMMMMMMMMMAWCGSS
eukprot:gene12382-biopygen9103